MVRTESDEVDDAEVSVDELAHLVGEVRELRREIDPYATFEDALSEAAPAPPREGPPRAPVSLHPPPLTLLPKTREGAARVLVVIAVVASLALLAQAYAFSWRR